MLAVAMGLIILASFGCNRANTKGSNEPQVEVAYQLIDDGQYSEAIDLFWTLLQHEDTPTIRIGLASAYAARAGILVQSYWDLILPLIKPQPILRNAKVDALKKDWKLLILKFPSHVQNILIQNEEKIFKSYEDLENFKTRFETIPLLTRIDQVGDVNMARSIIKDVAYRGTHLYRALLSLVLIRYEADQSLNQFHQTMSALDRNKSCSTQIKYWITNLENLSFLISDLIFDLKISYPSKVAEIEPFEKEFKNYSNTTNGLSNLLHSNLCN